MKNALQSLSACKFMENENIEAKRDFYFLKEPRLANIACSHPVKPLLFARYGGSDRLKLTSK